MAEPELSLTYSDLLSEVAVFLGYGSDSAAWTAGQRAECDRHVQSGVRRFYYPPALPGIEASYPWSFLNPVTTLATVADSRTQPMPVGFGRVLGDFRFEETYHQRSIVQVSEHRLAELVARNSGSGKPECFSLRPIKDPGRGQRYEVAWWPYPDAAYTLTYQYEAFAGKLSEDNPHPLGGQRHAELLIESCLAVAEQRSNDETGQHSAQFASMLAAAIEADRRQGARHFGPMGDPHDGFPALPRHHNNGPYSITYNGVEIT